MNPGFESPAFDETGSFFPDLSLGPTCPARAALTRQIARIIAKKRTLLAMGLSPQLGWAWPVIE